MDNRSRTLLKGLLAILTMALSSEELLNASDTNSMLLVGVLSVLALVFSTDQLVNTVKDVVTGKWQVSDSLLASPVLAGDTLKLIQPVPQPQTIQPPLSKLTTRETDVLGSMADGLMNKEIAQRLGISQATVKSHVTSILRKLNANVRTEAVVTAIKNGFINVRNTLDSPDEYNIV